ncbi:SIMPL domain-containing protein [Candidatus Nomurabacteria bacterium]|nr:SIMPL domain-containing protein [Candidatus Nomurabacteria bacterium]
MNHENILNNKNVLKALLAVLIILSLFLLSKTIAELNQISLGKGNVPNTITVNGKSEVYEKPDIASFNFSVVENAGTVALAQSRATEKTNKAVAFLKTSGVDVEKDVKTIGYDIYPKYDYQNYVCSSISCPPSRQILTGYEVSQSISVKVRKIEDAGKILSGIGDLGVSNVSGLDFSVDKKDELTLQVREYAIKDAKKQAEILSKSLGVKIDKIIGFSEVGQGPYPIYNKYGMGGTDMAVSATAPSIPTGQSKITSEVSITYEIR